MITAGSLDHLCCVCATPIKRICTVAVFFALLGSLAAQGAEGNASSILSLKGAGSLGEAATQTALRSRDVATMPPVAADVTGFAMRLSETVGGVSLASEPPPAQASAALPVSPLPISPPPSTPLPSVPMTVEVQSAEREKPPASIPSDVRVAKLPGNIDTDSGSRFGLAPIRWGGDVSETLRWNRYTNGSDSSAVSSLDNMQMINLRASSYIWQPWIAQVDGGIGLLHNTSSADAVSSSSNSITGNGALSLFARSRFPFRASFDVTDSRANMAVTSTDYRSQRLGLQQNYGTVSGESNFVVNADRSTITSSSFGDDIVTSMRGSYSARFGDSHSVSSNAFHTESRQPQRNAGLDLNGFTAQHTYRPDYLLTIDTNANLTSSTFNSQTLGVDNSNTSRYLQAGTTATWRPDEDKPLFVFGGARLFSGKSEYANVVNDTQSLSGNAGVSYTPTRNIGLNASTTATRATSAGTANLSTLQAANANYSADTITFKKDLSYKWNIGTGVTNETSSAGSNNQKITGFGFHSLYRPVPINESSMLNLNANQSLSSSYDRLYGMSTTLSHSGNVSWNGSKSRSLSGTANMTVGDVRIFGFNASDYQFATLQLDGRKQFSINASLNANVGLNWSHQSQAGQTTTNANSSVSYRHTRLFNVRGLRYSIQFSANTTSYDARLLGNVDAQRTQSGYSLDQHLDYHIGLLDTSLAAIVSELDGKQNASIFVRIGRNFGNM